MTRNSFQAQIIATSPPHNIDKVTVGVAVIREDRGTKEILLLKRNPDEAYFPNVFEIPGGKVNENDKSIRHAVKREAAEETGLLVTAVLSALSPMRYTTEKTTKDGSGNDVTVRRRTIQLSYIVAVDCDGEDFVVNKDEHSTGVWASLQILDTCPITNDMKSLVLEALSD